MNNDSMVHHRMAPADFITLCESLYGAGWQAKLARDLVRDIRTIRRWKTGESPVPKVVVEWLRDRADNSSLRRLTQEKR